MHPVCLVAGWLYAPRVSGGGCMDPVCELTVQLMLSYGAQSNCPIINLPHPTCYEAQGLGPTPSLASSHPWAY
jgi:hypothetical protein